MPNRYYDRVTILNAPLVDGYGGQKVRDWDNATQVPDVPAAVQPQGSTEDETGETLTITHWKLHVAPTVPLDPSSRVIWAGAARSGDPQGLLQVEGDVGLFKLLGRPHHIEASLVRAEYDQSS